jgi:Sugar transferases involved in lipopolysaccharide synthesis
MKKYGSIKRFIDIVVSAIALVVFLPASLIIAILIKMESKGPVLFKQQRIGKNKQPFTILKFRTMKQDSPCDVPTHLLIDEIHKHTTRIGTFLRKTSLDEWPQFINVLKGEMSLVGPRPALWNQYDLILAREYNGVNSIVPGLTGWAQINGRDALSIEAKAGFDGEYLLLRGTLFDIKIIFLTLIKVISGEGVGEGASASRGKGEFK